MPKKSKKNKGHRPEQSVRELEYVENGEEYAKVIKLLGDRKVTLMKTDRTEIMGVIPGKFRKRCIFKVNDVCIMSNRDFQIDKVDILHKYNDAEVKNLIQYGEIPDWFAKNAIDIAANSDIMDDDGYIWKNEDEDQEINFDDI